MFIGLSIQYLLAAFHSLLLIVKINRVVLFRISKKQAWGVWTVETNFLNFFKNFLTVHTDFRIMSRQIETPGLIKNLKIEFW
jgi:hypothetical protein